MGDPARTHRALGHGEGFGLYSVCDGKTLEGFQWEEKEQEAREQEILDTCLLSMPDSLILLCHFAMEIHYLEI